MKLKHQLAALIGGILFAAVQTSPAFVLMGPASAGETAAQTQFNLHDEMGTPKATDRGARRFWRWNQPYFVYSFDASFVGYFGTEGMDAVHQAINVVNDFFVNEDYSGMGELDLMKHGFAGNYNTTWVNTTAANAQIIDIKSLTLGMMVNHLGIGNSHRHMFTGVSVSSANNATQNFQVALRNYDPTSLLPTDTINGVQYSYRLIHNQANIGPGTPLPAVVDFEEFTTDTTGNSWTSVAAIADAFYGNTQLFWTDTPSLFNFGVYYDGMNSMGGQYSPRHALTYDDAGGLKYLYSTNNYVFERLDSAVGGVVLVEPAVFLPDYFAVNRLNPSGRQFPFPWPRKGGALNGGLPGAGNQLTTPIAQVLATLPTGLQNSAIRGGIDKIQFYYQPFDSLLGSTFTPTNFVWTDTFMWKSPVRTGVGISDASGNKVGSLSSKQSGIQWSSFNPNLQGLNFYPEPTWGYETATQKLGRSVTQPDLLFVAANLPNSADGVPIGWSRDVPVEAARIANMDSAGNYTYASAGNSSILGPGAFSLGAADSADAISGGAGAIAGLGARYAFAFNRGFHENFEVLWSGEASLVGNMDEQPQLWGYITGPGPNDVFLFPQRALQWKLENSIIPDTSPPTISMVSDNGGATPVEENTLTRTEETLTIIGNEMASVTAIEILMGDLVVQTIMPVDKYIVTNTRIDIPVGIISEAAEGAARQVRVWNSVGVSEKSLQKFNIETGLPVITSTSMDGFVWDRAETLTIRGFGFKSTAGTEKKITFIRVDDSTGAAIYDEGVHNNGGAAGASNGTMVRITGIDVVSDTMAVLPVNTVSSRADGSNRRLRVSREYAATASALSSNISPGSNPLIAAITTKPVISSLSQLTADNVTWESMTATAMFKRDRIVEINGTALNTVSTIEVIQQDGTSFPNPVFIQLPNAAVTVDDNGTRIMMGANAIPYSDADTNSSTAQRSFKIYNSVGNTDLDNTKMFAVNMQPVVDAIGGFGISGYLNRDKTYGDDLAIYGTGFLAVDKVYLTDVGDTSQNRIEIDLPANGITVTDSAIIVDKSLYQLGSGADTDVNSTQRLVKVTSARDLVTSPLAQRFYVGAPPTMGALGGVATGSRHYRRDVNTLTITGGTGYGHITALEIVDVNGNPIVGVPGLVTGPDGTGGTGLGIVNTTSLSVAPNAAGWSGAAHLLDSVKATGRRIKITTPFGTVTAPSNATSAFTMSATPTVGNTVQATFGGGGYAGGGNTYTYVANDDSESLRINGENFRGIKTIQFLDSFGAIYITKAVDPENPPAGLEFNAEGTLITVKPAFFTENGMGWLNSGGNAAMKVKLTGVADGETAVGGGTVTQTVTTQAIITAGGDLASSARVFSSLGNAVAGAYRRDNESLVINGINLDGSANSSTITQIELVDSAGVLVTGTAAIPVADFEWPLGTGGAGQVAVTSTAITINNNATWYGTTVADAADTTTALGRRLKITYSDGSTGITPADSTGAFTMSATPVYDANPDTAYTGTTGYNGGTNTWTNGTDDLKLTSAGTAPPANGSARGNTAPFNGVTKVEMRSGVGGATLHGTATLGAAGFTVNAAGTEITLTNAAVDAATTGSAWNSGATRILRLTTAAGQTSDTPAITVAP